MFLGHWWTLLHKVESVHGTRAASNHFLWPFANDRLHHFVLIRFLPIDENGRLRFT
jgi:hypothetical protein